MWDKTRKAAEIEFEQLNKLVDLNSPLLEKAAKQDPTSVELLAIAAILHSFYSGIENMFKRITKEIDQGLPEGPKWHKDLLASMMRSNDRRKAAISQDLGKKLEDYLGFRHTFRNLYSYDLKWSQLKPLAMNMRRVLDQLQAEIREFFLADKGGKE